MNKCEFCGIKLSKNDRVCPNCGGINSNYYDIDQEKIEETLDHQENTIKELQKDVNDYKEKHENKSKVIIILVIVLALMLIFPMICCCAMSYEILNVEISEEEKEDVEIEDAYEDDDYQYEYDENFQYSDNKLDLDDEIIVNINGYDLTIPMKTGDFIKNLEFGFPETYIINAENDDFVYTSDVSINVYNTTDQALDYKNCQIGGITFYFYDGAKYIGLNSFDFYGLTLESSPEDAEEIFGEPSVEYVSEYSIYKEWYTTRGWVEFYWTLNGELEQISIYNNSMFY